MRALLALAAAALLIQQAAWSTVADGDMFHEMSLIREALSHGGIPLTDTFAYTPTVYPVIHHEWGTGAVLYALVVGAGLGYGGVTLLLWLLLAGIAAGAWVGARRRGGHPLTCLMLAGLAGSLLAPGLSPVRAQMFTYLFVVVLLLLLPLHERWGWRFLAAWLACYVAWLNLHGGFVVGIGLYGLWTAERLLRTTLEGGGWRRAVMRHRILLAGVPLMGLATLINPYGHQYPRFVIEAVRMDRPYIAEWAPLWDPRVPPILIAGVAASLLVAVYAVFRSRNFSRLDGISLLAITALFTIQHQRMAPVYAIVWFCLLPGWLSHTPLQRLMSTRLAMSRAFAAAVAVLALALASTEVSNAQSWKLQIPETAEGDRYFYPVGAVRYLDQSGFEGNLMTTFAAGAYVSWMLHPRVRVSMDGRYEVAYPPEAVEENVAFYAAQPGWEHVLDRYATDAVLVPVHTPLFAELGKAQQTLGWIRIYEDDGYAVFMRTPAPE